MPYQFLGSGTLVYTQYTDNGRTLVAEPGGLYDPQPAAGAGEMPVPPADGQWGEWQEPPAGEPIKETPAPKGRAGKTAASAAKGE